MRLLLTAALLALTSLAWPWPARCLDLSLLPGLSGPFAYTADDGTRLAGRLSVRPRGKGLAVAVRDLVFVVPQSNATGRASLWALVTPTGGVWTASGLRLSLTGLRLEEADRDNGDGGDGMDLTLTGNARYDTATGGMELRDLALEAGGLRLTGVAGIRNGRTTASLRGQDLDLAALAALAGRLSPALAGWELGGRADLELDLGARGEGGARLALDIRDGGFFSPGGDLGDKLAGALRLTLPVDGRGRASVEAAVTGGEVLVGTVYADLARHPLSLRGEARLTPGALREAVLTARAEGYAAVEARGAVWDMPDTGGPPPAYKGELAVSDVDLGALFTTLVKEPMALNRPGLATLNATGRARLSLNATGRGLAADLAGLVELWDLDLSAPDEAFLERGRLRLPFAYALGVNATAQGEPEVWGEASAALVKLPLPGAEPDVLPRPLELALVPNRLHVGRSPLVLPLLDGELVASGLTVDQPLSGHWQALADVFLQNVDLSRLGSDIPVEGRLDGDLGRVRASMRRVEAPGRLGGELFGGALYADGLAVERPFAVSRAVRANVHVSLMDLQRFTAALGAGMVTGRMDLTVRDLALAYGQPVGFTMTAKSVETDDAPQRVSLKAINSISVVGTGAGVQGLGMRLFASVFESFPYESIGVYCRLEDDVFRVRGLLVEGGVEYLIKRPPLAGLNVVNGNPDNRIGFSDMVKRLKRVLEAKGDET